MKRLLLLVIAAVYTLASSAQVLTWSPAFPKETEGLEITLDATRGNQGLMGFNGPVYVHIGAITSKSTSSADWKYSKFQWATTPAEASTVSLGNNKWKYTITGSLRTYFNITDPTETIRYIAILLEMPTVAGCSAMRMAAICTFRFTRLMPLLFGCRRLPVSQNLYRHPKP
jgi:hypothetical protein